jgi:hypothetical protein
MGDVILELTAQNIVPHLDEQFQAVIHLIFVRTMSDFDQLTQDSTKEIAADIETAANETVQSDIAKLENLLSKPLTSNKRAIVDKLVAIYKSEAR